MPITNAEAVARYRAKHREELNAKSNAYHKAYPKKHAMHAKAWRDRHPEKIKSTQSRWRKTHPKLVKQYAEKHRALKAGSITNDLTLEQWKQLKTSFKHCCAYCGKKYKRLTQDHITPLSKGGLHTLSNIVPACQSCNSRKHTGAPLKPVQPSML
mgnify:FL=1